MRQAIVAAVVIGLLAAVVALGVWTWVQLGDVAISWHGVFAMAAAILGIAGLGGGLMALVFYSHRSGRDDDVGR